MSERFLYNSPILTNIINVNDVGTAITWNTTLYGYESFLIDNQSDWEVIITGIGGATIRLSSGSYIEIEQDLITAVTIKAETGKTADVMYKFQGYKK